MVLPTGELVVSRNLRKVLRRRPYALRLDSAFDEVIGACASTPRPGQDGTWITPEMKQAYARLHDLGLAHSVEAWQDGALVGGLYGVSLGGIFFGESMFARSPDASKVAFVALVQQLVRWQVELVDCQIHTEHLARFGAREWPRTRYLGALRRALDRSTRRGPWRFDAELLAALSAPPAPD